MNIVTIALVLGVILLIVAAVSLGLNFNLSAKVEQLRERFAQLGRDYSAVIHFASGGKACGKTPAELAMKRIADFQAEVRDIASGRARANLLADRTNGMTTAELTVLAAMNGGSVPCIKLSDIARETNLTEKTVGLIVRWLQLRGLAEFGPLYAADDHDGGNLRGRGYFLNMSGLLAKATARKALSNTAPAAQQSKAA